MGRRDARWRHRRRSSGSHAPGLHTENHESPNRDRTGRTAPEVRDEFYAAGVRHAIEPIATLGARHAVHRVVQTWPETAPEGPIDYRSICVTQTDEDGRLSRRCTGSPTISSAPPWCSWSSCGPTMSSTAPSESGPLPLGSSGCRRPRSGATGRRAYHALDTVVVDHRPAGWGTLHGRAAVWPSKRRRSRRSWTTCSGELVDVYALTAELAVTQIRRVGHPGTVASSPDRRSSCSSSGRTGWSSGRTSTRPSSSTRRSRSWTSSRRRPRQRPRPLRPRRPGSWRGPGARRWRRADENAIAAVSAPDIVIEDRRPSLQSRSRGASGSRGGHDADPAASWCRHPVRVRWRPVGSVWRSGASATSDAATASRCSTSPRPTRPDTTSCGLSSSSRSKRTLRTRNSTSVRSLSAVSNGRRSGWLPRGPLRTAPATSNASVTASLRMRSSSTTGLLGSAAATRDEFVDLASELFALGGVNRTPNRRGRCRRRHEQPSSGCARPAVWTGASSRTRAGHRVSSMRVGWDGSSCFRPRGGLTRRPAWARQVGPGRRRTQRRELTDEVGRSDVRGQRRSRGGDVCAGHGCR